jgi:glucose/arabinose dehydrogenase
MVAVPARNDSQAKRLRRGARGRYAPPQQLFPLTAIAHEADGQWRIERDPDGAYLVHHRATGRLVARTADPATLQRLLMTLAADDRA